MTPEEKQAWIYAQEHRVRRAIRVFESGRKAAIAKWDKDLRVLNGHMEDLERAADDSGQLELFDVELATPGEVAVLLDRMGASGEPL